MLKRKNFWITLALANLCIVPLLGMLLRTKFLFEVPFIDYKNLLSAHSHFAFGGWVTLMLMIFFIDNLLPEKAGAKNKYQYVLWGIEFTAIGMVLIFPFTGYGLLAIIFSTLFIFCTYAFSWMFIKDFLKAEKERSVSLFAITALGCLVISSVGPFTLAYMLATKTGTPILFRDAIYTYLHFQYNGFFTLGVFALFFNHIKQVTDKATKGRIYLFSVCLSLSVLPTLFLSLNSPAWKAIFHILSVTGVALLLCTLVFFLTLMTKVKRANLYSSRIAYVFWSFAMISFAMKILLQMGTIVPQLAVLVFGYRPIIIGFLHLVFLGFVTFYLLAELINSGAFSLQKKITKLSLYIFAGAIILNETVLMIQGMGLLLTASHPAFAWLLWIASILLFIGALLMFIGRFTRRS